MLDPNLDKDESLGGQTPTYITEQTRLSQGAGSTFKEAGKTSFIGSELVSYPKFWIGRNTTVVSFKPYLSRSCAVMLLYLVVFSLIFVKGSQYILSGDVCRLRSIFKHISVWQNILIFGYFHTMRITMYTL